MVSFTNISRLALLGAGLLSLVSAAVLPSREEDSASLVRRSRGMHGSDTWDEYHETNRLFAQQGLCMVYLDPTERQGAWACGPYCQNENTKVCFSPGVNNPDHLINTNPNGERFVVGRCDCNSGADKIAEILVDFTGRGLDEGFRHLAKLSCEVMMNILKEAAFVGAQFIPGAGQAAVAARTAVKAVKLASKTTGGKDIWTRTVEGTCGAFDSHRDIMRGYDELLGRDDLLEE